MARVGLIAITISVLIHAAAFVWLRRRPLESPFVGVERVYWVQKTVGKGASKPATAETLRVPEKGPGESAPALPATAPSYSVADVVGFGNQPPEYPFTARKNGWEGRVELKILLRPGGERPSDVLLVSSSGHAILDETALDWARRCKIPHGSAIDLLLPVDFRLD